MGGWLNPLAFMPKQSGFFLPTGHRNSKVVIAAQAKWVCRQIPQKNLNVTFWHCSAGEHTDRLRLFAFWQDLQRADTVASNNGQQAVCIGAICPDTPRKAGSDLIIIWQ